MNRTTLLQERRMQTFQDVLGYNTEHRHAGIAMLTPDDVHHHRASDVLAQRGRTLQAAWALHPERFVHGTPKPDPLPEAVWINPPATPTTGETSQ